MINLLSNETMVGKNHLINLKNDIKYINDNKINGSIVECGVWKGGCIAWLMYCQKEYNENRDIYLYDTFQGMTKPINQKNGKKCIKYYNEITNGTRQTPWEFDKNKWAFAPKEYVIEVINKVNYDNKKIKIIEGDINKTLNIQENIPDEISILRLDTDWYESTKKELDFLYPKVSKGGIIIIDDYYTWQGAKIATNEFLAKNKNNIKLVKSDRFKFIKMV